MNTNRQGYRQHTKLKTTKTRLRVPRTATGDVALPTLTRDVRRGWVYFCERRGLDPESFQYGMGAVQKTERKENNTAEAIARHYLAIPTPPPGLLKRMAEGAGLSYGAVWHAMVALRRQRRRAA